jgi:acylphosphatase
MAGAGRIRVRVSYSGRVQGVGFRATCLQLSRRTVVVGFVRNLDDGTVELEAEGAERHVDDFLASVQAHMGGFIASVERTAIAPLETERTFEIQD